MAKNTVNLIITRDEEPAPVKKLKIILPIAAIVVLLIFIIVFVASILYINKNIVAYNILKRNVEQLEKNIASRKNIEGVYTLTSLRLKVLDELSARIKDFPAVMDDVDKLNGNGIIIKSVSSDSKGNISFSVSASNSSSLNDFVNLLKAFEGDKHFSQIKASGITREKKGIYDFSITFNKDITAKNEKQN